MGSRPTLRVFGPVPSRRLGRSLGVNNLPGKRCSYSCTYCQAGRTTRLCETRRPYAPPDEIRDEVEAALDACRVRETSVDVVSFVPSGEPTLDEGLGRSIDAIRRLGVRVAVFTNGSLLWRSDVRDELALADWVSVKVDAASEFVWRRINRPCRTLSLERHANGLVEFARSYQGTLVTETMLVAGVNDAPGELEASSRMIATLAPSVAWLAVPVRPPAESWVRPPGALGYARALTRFTSRLATARPLLPEDVAPPTSLELGRSQLLAMTAVHPLRHSELAEARREAGMTWQAVAELLEEGSLEEVTYGGQRFYRRRTPARAH